MKKQELIDVIMSQLNDAIDELQSDNCDIDKVEEYLDSAIAFTQSGWDDENAAQQSVEQAQADLDFIRKFLGLSGSRSTNEGDLHGI